MISVHNLETFALKFTLHKTKGATVFAVNIKVCSEDNKVIQVLYSNHLNHYCLLTVTHCALEQHNHK